MGRTITGIGLVSFANLTWFTGEGFVHDRRCACHALPPTCPRFLLVIASAEGWVARVLQFTGLALLNAEPRHNDADARR